jgi:hypothetical protein
MGAYSATMVDEAELAPIGVLLASISTSLSLAPGSQVELVASFVALMTR